LSAPAKTFKDLPISARAGVCAFGVVGAAALLVALTRASSLDAGAFFLMLSLAVVTARAKVRLIGGSTLSLLTSVVLATVMWLGTEAAIIISMVGVVVQSAIPWRPKAAHHVIFNIGMVGVTVTLAGLGYDFIVRDQLPTAADQFAGILAASFIYYLCNSVFVSMIVSMTSRTPMWNVWHSNFLYTAPAFFLAGIIAMGALKLASIIHFGVLAAIVPVLLLTYYSHRVYMDSLAKETKHAAEMAELNETLEMRVAERSESLRIAKEQAEQASRTKSAFLANMSHELRTPLNAIIGYSEILYEDAVGSGRTETLEDLLKIRTAGKHLLTLINDVLDLTKIEAGKIQIHPEPFDLREVMDEVVSSVQPQAVKNRNTLGVTLDSEISMVTDRVKLTQVLINLISNACKFAQSGSITVAARVRPGERGECVEISVTDTGIGMHPDQIERLFEPFVQADSSTTRKFGGTGLGLAISRQFCRLLGGDISVSSALGEGSTFSVIVPVEYSSRQLDVPAPAATDSANSELAGEAGRTVVVIDDDPAALELLARYLRKEQYTPICCSNVREGLELAKRIQPAAVTMDIKMDGIDGWTALRMMQSDAQLSETPVIVVSVVDDMQKAMDLGARAFLSKPISRGRLADELEKCQALRADKSETVRPVETVESTTHV